MHLFEEQARLRPEAVALVAANGGSATASWTRRSRPAGASLRRLGVGPEVRVGLCRERSPELVVGLLGILKAGGAYCPSIPAYPRGAAGAAARGLRRSRWW